MARTRYARRSVQLHHTSRTRRLQLAQVDIPNEIPNTTAVFIVLRKMRGPLIALISIMTVGVIGLSLMPGVPQPDGGHGRLDAFEAFYVMTYTATTIGFGEIPHVFSIEQRWWIIFSIYAAVIGWAYALAKLMGLLQDSAFTTARAGQSFRRTISRLREPFTIIVGYGYIGRSVARALDQRHRRVVIIDRDTVPIERLATDLLSEETPGLTADARRP
ncbi:MAG: NAD-binding protein, partial [Propionibacteriaceae bacterium]|nr:NAD-binding protein [Propionibacteriaceae bacterium]